MKFIGCRLEKRFRFLTPIFIHAIRHRYSSGSHYQILGVSKSASTDDIRQAFLQLSKKLHPDLNRHDPKTHEKFVQLNEAYKVLSKAATRHEYDTDLALEKHRGSIHIHRPRHQYYDDSHRDRIFRDESIWSMRDKSQDRFYDENSYYGINGIRRVSNAVIVYGCIMIICVGALVHYYVIKLSAGYHIALLDEKDKKGIAIYNKSKERAKEFGNAAQLEMFRMEAIKNDRTPGMKSIPTSDV